MTSEPATQPEDEGSSAEPPRPADGLEAAIKRRRMVRSLKSDPLPPRLIDELLDLARRAPSAGNTQATGFVVLDRPDLTDRYWNITLPEPKRSAFRWQGLLQAPVLVLVTTEPQRYPDRYQEADKVASGRTSLADWPVPYWWVDAGTVIQNLLLLVAGHGLGACLFGPFDHESDIAAEFSLPTDTRIVATIAVGYRDQDEAGRSFGRARRPLSEVVVRPAPRTDR